jgi:signal transduction histidine kinase
MTVGTGATAHVRLEGTPVRLDASHEHHLLRIGLEALTNALKHSGAGHIEIVVRFEPDATTLVVQDDGRGIGPVDADLSSGHFGLQGIRERVDKLGGVLSIDSAQGRGTCVSVTAPARHPGRAGGFAQAAT